MSRFERWAVWSTTLATAVTGIGYFWTRYLVESPEPFAVINHPLEPVFLKLHILVSPLLLFALGLIAVRHVWQHFASGVRVSRRAGIVTALAILPMVVTGYLLQVLTGEGWLEAMAVSHIAFGTLYLAGILLHRWLIGRAPARRRTVATRRRSRVPEGAEDTPDEEAMDVRPMREPKRRRGEVGAGTAGVVALAALLAGAACGGEPEAGAAGDAPADAPATASEVFPGTPAGGLEDWVEDIRSGLEGLPARLREEPAAAEQSVVELYLGRQEFIERYYGRGGPRAGGEPLAAAVLEAEAGFHDLMRLAGRRPPPDSASVADAVSTLRARLGRVLERAREAGVPLDPPADAGAAGDGGGASEDAVAGAGAAAGHDADPAPAPGLPERIERIEAGLAEVERTAEGGPAADARAAAVRVYLDDYEPIEVLYGRGGPLATERLAARVTAGEQAFHALMRAEAGDLAAAAAALRETVREIGRIAREEGVPLRPDPDVLAGLAGGGARAGGQEPGPGGPRPEYRSPEVESIAVEVERAQRAYEAGDADRALAGIEHAYLEGFELLEPRLPAPAVRGVERIFHLRLRPAIARARPPAEVQAGFGALYAELRQADAALASPHGFWFGAFNAFSIILREGLEAVLLIGAILAYLSRVSGDPRHARQVWAGVGMGIAASIATWGVARVLIPVGGASRELIEGITALLAVAVLVYVSNWLFHKTYVHDWKEYLKDRVSRAVTTGSALAMAALAFAAVYREGFETVLFYQALLFDVGAPALLAGFLPGLALIVAIGAAIIRLGLRLPIGKLFAATNAVLIYLAFVFVGKGLYNLQEAGLFSPRPVAWAPDHEALRQLFGFYPIAETMLAQAGFLLLMAATYVYYRSRSGRSAGAGERAPAGAEAGGVRREERAAAEVG